MRGERSDVRKMYLHTKRPPPPSSPPPSSFFAAASLDLFLLTVLPFPSPFSFLVSLSTAYSPYTLSPCVFDRSSLLCPIPDRYENGAPTRTRPGPPNLTWQVPAEWTQARAPSTPSPFLSSCFVPMPVRLSVRLTFSVFPIYGRLLSAFFASLPRDDGRDRSCLLYGTHKKRWTGALSIIYRVTPR